MMHKLAGLSLWAGLALAAPVLAEPALPAAPARFVTDTVGLLSPVVRERLESRLAAFEQAKGHQVVVWIGATIGDAVLEDWAARTFAAWGVGRKGLDDGVVLFVLAQDRQARLEVGYGLEGALPDALASRILRESVLPRMARGDADGAVTAGVGRVMEVLGGARVAQDPPAAPLSPVQKLLLALVGLALLVLLLTHPQLAMWLLYALFSGRRSGGQGGGFSGGGGRSGGGGASGRW